MEERIWIVGSRPDCDIRVESRTVSGRHCRLIDRGGALWLEDLASSNGTFVAGERITGPRIVRRGDSVTLGRETPLPWPPLAASITIGRLPDNDLVIPLDVVSGHHARLERDGNEVILVDLGSSNGTSLNDPLNKISRTPVKAGDAVYFGTHRVAAADLLAALPAEAPRGTVFEASPPIATPEPAVATDATNVIRPGAESHFEAWRSLKSWGLGIALSAACIAVVVAARWGLRADSKPEQPEASSPPAATSQLQPGDPKAAPENRTTATRTPAPVPAPAPVSFDEQLIRKSQAGVSLISVRTDRLIGFTRSTAWSISPNAVVCPTNILSQIESKLTKGDKLDDCIVVCSPSQTLRIMSHEPLGADFSFLSIARLESASESICPTLVDAASFSPALGQKLALLVAHGAHAAEQQDDPKTITRRLILLKIEQIQRDASQSPVALYCTAAESPGPAVAAPVFDGAGRVVGCVESTDKTDVRVVPLARLKELDRIVP
jgi:pSer/pThr/pTyr-binding forkhead associated (FHA) protein